MKCICPGIQTCGFPNCPHSRPHEKGRTCTVSRIITEKSGCPSCIHEDELGYHVVLSWLNGAVFRNQPYGVMGDVKRERGDADETE